MEKHGGRVENRFPKAKGDVGAKNKQGQHVLDDILTDPSGKTVYYPENNGYGVYSQDGRGAFFYNDGKFRGFLEY